MRIGVEGGCVPVLYKLVRNSLKFHGVGRVPSSAEKSDAFFFATLLLARVAQDVAVAQYDLGKDGLEYVYPAFRDKIWQWLKHWVDDVAGADMKAPVRKECLDTSVSVDVVGKRLSQWFCSRGMLVGQTSSASQPPSSAQPALSTFCGACADSDEFCKRAESDSEDAAELSPCPAWVTAFSISYLNTFAFKRPAELSLTACARSQTSKKTRAAVAAHFIQILIYSGGWEPFMHLSITLPPPPK
jgi:hypothetical protein